MSADGGEMVCEMCDQEKPSDRVDSGIRLRTVVTPVTACKYCQALHGTADPDSPPAVPFNDQAGTCAVCGADELDGSFEIEFKTGAAQKRAYISGALCSDCGNALGFQFITRRDYEQDRTDAVLEERVEADEVAQPDGGEDDD